MLLQDRVAQGFARAATISIRRDCHL
jgi:hypothetical protein